MEHERIKVPDFHSKIPESQLGLLSKLEQAHAKDWDVMRQSIEWQNHVLVDLYNYVVDQKPNFDFVQSSRTFGKALLVVLGVLASAAGIWKIFLHK